MKDSELTLEDARAAWEADKANGDKARIYGLRLASAALAGEIAPAECIAALTELRDDFAAGCGLTSFAELSDKLIELAPADAGEDMLEAAAIRLHGEGTTADHVVAVNLHNLGPLKALEVVTHHAPGDSIGEPIGHA